MTNTTSTIPQRKYIGVLTLAAVLLIAASGLAYFSGLIPSSIDPFRELQMSQLNDAIELTSKGNYTDAIAKASGLISELQPGLEREQALSVLTTAQFNSGDKNERIESVALTKQRYFDLQGQPYEQALQLNKLLGNFMAGQEMYVFDAIFSGPTFGDLKAEGDIGTSLRNLAEFSLAHASTTEAHFRIGLWYSDRMRNTWGDWDLTAAQKDEYAQKIVENVESSEEIFAQEMARMKGRIFDYTVEPRYRFWRAFLYGVAAREMPQYLSEARDELQALENLHRNTRDSEGNTIPMTATRLPYAYYNYASAVEKVWGLEKGKAEITQNLDALIATIRANPSIHAGQYLSLVREGASLTPQEQKRKFPAWLRFAKLHPPYKAFLEEYGWTFTQ